MKMESSIDDKIDELELAMQDYDPVDCPLTHTFTPKVYTRVIFMQKGSLITSRVHRTRHQFAILAGVVLVKVKEGEWKQLAAPCNGITEPGTRRILYILEDCVWMTIHFTDVVPKDDSEESILEAVKMVEGIIIEPYENKLLGGIVRNNIISQSIDNQ
jgi:hypothetical protein